MSYSSTLESLDKNGNFRSIPPDSTALPELVDLSGNDYLGIACRRELTEEFFAGVDPRNVAMTSSASRLLAAGQEEYARLESCLSELYGGRHCLLFNSGYHANTGMLSALASEPGTLIVADKLVHASMIDGMILSRAPFIRFAHNDIVRLEDILKKEHDRHDRIIVAVESVYSMDGDSADIDRLIDLKRLFPKVLLYVDEAHAFGVSGPYGLGYVMGSKAPSEVDVIIGTFGKAAASMGAFAITGPVLHDYAVNRARSFIFSTALPPINCRWTRFVIERMIMMDAERAHLRKISGILHDRICLAAPSRTIPEPSHIIPLIIGDASLTVNLSVKLRNEGFKVLPIRTPTVPPGTERLRISLNASLPVETIARFADILSVYILPSNDNRIHI